MEFPLHVYVSIYNNTYKHALNTYDMLCCTGNADLAWLTSQNDYKLRFDLQDWDEDTRYAEYGTFTVGPASDGYRLDVGDYTGDAGTY
jgi:hypothetical protein